MSGAVTVELVTTPDQLAAALAIRVTVFVAEQGVPLELEQDDADHEPGTVHLLALLGGVPVGTGRLLPPTEPGAAAHIGRVAVLPQARGRHIGVALMRAAEAEAWRRFSDGTWPRADTDSDLGAAPALRVELSAQETAVPFYQRLGYVIGERRYLDAGIWHRDAARTLTSIPGDQGG